MRDVVLVLWAPAAVVGVHALATALLGHRTSLDPIFHFLGGAAGGFALLQFLTHFPHIRNWLPIRVNLAGFVMAAMLGIVLMWEAGEFLSDTLFRTQVQMSRGDTLADVALGLAGAAVVALTSLRRAGR